MKLSLGTAASYFRGRSFNLRSAALFSVIALIIAFLFASFLGALVYYWYPYQSSQPPEETEVTAKRFDVEGLKSLMMLFQEREARFSTTTPIATPGAFR